jgi:hypothetical protein
LCSVFYYPIMVSKQQEGRYKSPKGHGKLRRQSFPRREFAGEFR